MTVTNNRGLYRKLVFQNDLSLFIASIAAAQSVETIGNSVPVNKVMLLKIISHFLEKELLAFEKQIKLSREQVNASLKQ